MSETNTACENKISFDTRKQANTAKIVAGLQHGTKLKVYRCKRCTLWHLATHFDD